MDNGVQFSRAVNLIILQIVSLKNYLSSAKALKYSDPSIINFIESLNQKLLLLESEILSLVAVKPKIKTALNRIQRTHRAISIISGYLLYVRNAKIQWLPWSLIGAVHDLASDIAPKVDVIVTGTLHPTYRIIPPHPKVMNGSDAGEDNNLKYMKCAIIEIPFIHRRNSLFHVLVGHELFHLHAKKFVGEISSNAFNEIEKFWEPELKKKHTDLVLSLGNDEQFDWIKKEQAEKVGKDIRQVTDHAHMVWKQAFIELFCDMGCLYYFGPSALFALADLSLIVGDRKAKTSPSKHHPTFKHRLYLLCSALKNYDKFSNGIDQLDQELRNNDLEEFADVFMERIDQIGSLESEDIKPEEFTETIYKIAYRVLLPNIKNLWCLIEECELDESKCWFNTIEESIYHLTILKNSIPSGSFIKPGDFVGTSGNYSSIAQAAWIQILHKLFRNEKAANTPDLNKKYLDDCNLLFKSFDDAHSINEFILDRD